MAKADFRIAVLPGDGIGCEVMNEAVRVLSAAQQHIGGFRLSMETFSVGAGELSVVKSRSARILNDLPAVYRT